MKAGLGRHDIFLGGSGCSPRGQGISVQGLNSVMSWPMNTRGLNTLRAADAYSTSNSTNTPCSIDDTQKPKRGSVSKGEDKRWDPLPHHQNQSGPVQLQSPVGQPHRSIITLASERLWEGMALINRALFRNNHLLLLFKLTALLPSPKFSCLFVLNDLSRNHPQSTLLAKYKYRWMLPCLLWWLLQGTSNVSQDIRKTTPEVILVRDQQDLLHFFFSLRFKQRDRLQRSANNMARRALLYSFTTHSRQMGHVGGLHSIFTLTS